MYKTILKIVPLLFLCNVVFAQSGIKVRVIDSVSSQPLSYANVVLEKEDELLEGAWTNMNGNAELKPVDTGIYYVIVILQGYVDAVKAKVRARQDSTASVTIAMKKTPEIIVAIPPAEPKNNCLATSMPGIFVPAETCWASGNFDRVEISRFPTNDFRYVQEFFPHR